MVRSRLHLPLLLCALSLSFFFVAFSLARAQDRAGYALNSPAAVRLACEDRENFPFYMGEGVAFDPEKPGLSIELLQRVGEKLGLDFQFKRMPWKRCKNDLKHGKVDGIFNASFDHERRRYGVYPMRGNRPDDRKRMCTVSYVLYKHRGASIGWDGEYFHKTDIVVGAPMGFSISEELKGLGVTVDESPGTLNDLFKLSLFRIDAVAALEYAGDHHLKKYPKEFADIIKVDKPLKVKPYYLLLSRQFVLKYPELSKKIWDTIEEVRLSPWMDQVWKKYIP